MDTGLDFLKSASKQVVDKIGDFLGNKIAEAVTSLYINKIVKTEPVVEIIVLTEKNRRNIKQIKTSIIKIEHYEISKQLND